MEYPKQREIEVVRKTVHQVNFEHETVIIPIGDLVQMWAYIRWLENLNE